MLGMAFTGKIYWTTGFFEEGYLASFDTRTSELKVVTEENVGVPANFAGLQGVGPSADGNLLVICDYYGTDQVSTFAVASDFSVIGAEYTTTLGEYPVFECYFNGVAIDSRTDLNWLPYNISDAGTPGNVEGGWSPVSAWDSTGTMVGRAGFIDNSALDYDTLDFAPGSGGNAAKLTLRGDWLYYFSGTSAMARVNIATDVWEYSWFRNDPTTYGMDFCDLGVVTWNLYLPGPSGTIDVWAWDDILWHDYNTHKGDILTASPGWDMTGLSPIRTFDLNTDESTEAIDNSGPNSYVIGNNLYWAFYELATQELHWKELNLDTLVVTTVATVPPSAWDNQGNPVPIGDGAEFDHPTSHIGGLWFEPLPDLHIVGQLDTTRVRPYHQYNQTR